MLSLKQNVFLVLSYHENKYSFNSTRRAFRNEFNSEIHISNGYIKRLVYLKILTRFFSKFSLAFMNIFAKMELDRF